MNVQSSKLPKEEEFLKKVNDEIEKDRPINAILLIHGLIEAYLLEILLYSGKMNIKEINRRVIDDIERAGFKYLLNINFILGNISFKLYNRTENFNKRRNKIVHELISMNVNNPKIKRMIIKEIKNGLDIYKQLLEIYNKKIKERTKYFLGEGK